MEWRCCPPWSEKVKFKGNLITQASGSIAGVTASHNRGGQYFRARSIPVSPNTPQQAFMKSTLANLSASWSEILTSPNRDAWNTYALATPLLDALGDPRNVGGLGMFVRGNAGAIQAAMTRIDAGPATPGLAILTAPGITSISAGTQLITYTFLNSDAWAGAVGGAIFVYASRPQEQSINGFKGPFRFAGRTLGAGTPPTSPKTHLMPFTVSIGQKVFVRFAARDAIARLSASYLIPATVVA